MGTVGRRSPHCRIGLKQVRCRDSMRKPLGCASLRKTDAHARQFRYLLALCLFQLLAVRARAWLRPALRAARQTLVSRFFSHSFHRRYFRDSRRLNALVDIRNKTGAPTSAAASVGATVVMSTSKGAESSGQRIIRTERSN